MKVGMAAQSSSDSHAFLFNQRLGMDLDFSEGETFQEVPHWMEFVDDYDIMLEAVTRMVIGIPDPEHHHES